MGNASSGVFAKLAASIAKVVRSPVVDFAAHAEYIEAHYLRLRKAATANATTTKSFSLALYSEADGSSLVSDYMAALAVQCHVLLTHTIARLAEASTAESQTQPRTLLVAHAACSSSMCATHNHWATTLTSIAYVVCILVPYLESVGCTEYVDNGEKKHRHAILLIDAWWGWLDLEFRDFCKKRYPWLHLIYVPGACTPRCANVEHAVAPLAAQAACH